MRKPNGYIRIMVGAALVLMGAAVPAKEAMVGGKGSPLPAMTAEAGQMPSIRGTGADFVKGW